MTMMYTREVLASAGIERTRRAVLRRLADGKPVTGAALRRAVATRDRTHLDTALQRLLDAGTVVAHQVDRTDAGHGGPGTRYRLTRPAGVTGPRMSTPAGWRRRRQAPIVVQAEPAGPLQVREDEDVRVCLVANALAQVRRGEPHDPWSWTIRIQDDVDRARQLVDDLDAQAAERRETAQ
jgi:hypothetical protein